MNPTFRLAEFSGKPEQWAAWSFRFKTIAQSEIPTIDLFVAGAENEPQQEADKWRAAQRKLFSLIVMWTTKEAHTKIMMMPAEDQGNGTKAWNVLTKAYERNKQLRLLELRRKLHAERRMPEGADLKQHIQHYESIRGEMTALGERPEPKSFFGIVVQGLPQSMLGAVSSVFLAKQGDNQNDEDYVEEQFAQLRIIGDAMAPMLTNDPTVALQTTHSDSGCFKCGNNGHHARDCKLDAHLKARGMKIVRETSRETSSETSTQEQQKGQFRARGRGRGHTANGRGRGRTTSASAAFDDIEPHSLGMVARVCHMTRDCNRGWFVDSACTTHMTPHREDFQSLKQNNTRIKVANDEDMKAEGKGEVQIPVRTTKGQLVVLKIQALFVPKLSQRLFSVSEATEKGHEFVFGKDKAKLKVKNSDQVIEIPAIDGLFQMQPAENGKAFVSKYALDHQILGHVPEAILRKADNEGKIVGLGRAPTTNCKPCVEANSKVAPKSTKPVPKATEKGELVFTDVFGPTNVSSIGGMRYALLFVDSYTRKRWAYFMQSKGEVPSKLQEFLAELRAEGVMVKRIHSDGGGEFVSKQFRQLCTENLIHVTTTAPYSPHQNGVVERSWQTICRRVRAMVLQAKTPAKLWTAAFATAVYALNRTPTVANDNTTPYQLWHGKPPDISHMHVFGCPMFVHVETHTTKFQPKAEQATFVGYDRSSRSWLALMPNEKIRRTRSASFDDNFSTVMQSQSKNEDEDSSEWFVFGGESQTNDKPVWDEPEVPHQAEPDQSGEQTQSPVIAPVTPTSTPQVSSPTSVSAEPQPQQTEQRRTSSRSTKGKKSKRLIEECDATRAQEKPPSTFKQATNELNHDVWWPAIESELNSHAELGTWEIVNRPGNCNVVGHKWVFTVKANGRKKARLVATGYTQLEGIDYNETFSPVVRFDSLRLLVSIAMEKGWQIEQSDVNTAFLNAVLEEQIYMDIPQGHPQQGEPNKVCRLIKAIYGLKQSPRMWNREVTTWLKSDGFKQSKKEPCLFVKREDGKELLLCLYVDDMVYGGDQLLVDNFKKALSNKYKVTHEGRLHRVLGIEFEWQTQHNQHSVKMHQTSFVEETLELYNMQDSVPVSVPLDPNTQITKDQSPTTDEEKEAMKKKPYRNLIGKLRYMVSCTRPDLSFAVGLLSRFMSNPGLEHWRAAKRVLRYLKHTTTLGLTFSRPTTPTLMPFGYSDASYAGGEEARSTSGYVFVLNGAAVSWNSSIQSVVAISTTEAEFIALSGACQEAVFLCDLICDMRGCGPVPVPMHEDCTSCIQLVHNPEFHKRTKHIKTKFYFARTCYEEGRVTVDYCPTREMIADHFTKSLPRQVFESHRAKYLG